MKRLKDVYDLWVGLATASGGDCPRRASRRLHAVDEMSASRKQCGRQRDVNCARYSHFLSDRAEILNMEMNFVEQAQSCS
jgi:hypothetical protein